jgi:hypothetical protein
MCAQAAVPLAAESAEAQPRRIFPRPPRTALKVPLAGVPVSGKPLDPSQTALLSRMIELGLRVRLHPGQEKHLSEARSVQHLEGGRIAVEAGSAIDTCGGPQPRAVADKHCSGPHGASIRGRNGPTALSTHLKSLSFPLCWLCYVGWCVCSRPSGASWGGGE